MTKKYLSNDTAQGGGQMDLTELKQVLGKYYGEKNAEFFAYAIHEQSGEMLETSERYTALFDWVNNELINAGIVLNVFSPADKTDDYTNGNFKLWLENLQNIGVLVWFRQFLMDNNATMEQRRNIEYTCCKLYGIHYNEDLGVYV